MVGVRILVVREREKRKEVVKLIFIPSFHQKTQTVLVSPPSSFCRVSFRQLEYFSNNKPHFSSAYDITSKQVLVPKRGKKKY